MLTITLSIATPLLSLDRGDRPSNDVLGQCDRLAPLGLGDFLQGVRVSAGHGVRRQAAGEAYVVRNRQACLADEVQEPAHVVDLREIALPRHEYRLDRLLGRLLGVEAQ